MSSTRRTETPATYISHYVIRPGQRSRAISVSKSSVAPASSPAACPRRDSGRYGYRLAPSTSWGEERHIGRNPFSETADPGLLVDERFPSEEFARLPNVADVARLIAGPPIVEGDGKRFLSEGGQETSELPPHRERVEATSADIEDFAGHAVDLFDRETQGAHKIVDKEHIPHLLAVAVNRDRAASKRRDDEMGHPSLVLGAKLTRPINAAHAEDNGRQPVYASIVPDILVGRPLRAAIGGMEVKRLRF